MTISQRDKSVVWHPFTQHQMVPFAKTIVSGKGAYLFDQNGHRVLDLISSWWVNLHGHAQPEIARAIYEQALKLEHILFAHFTHEPAVQLAEEVLQILPRGFSKVFYSDNGSTSVEIALKMAYQYWQNVGEPERKHFISFENAYHGDTFGAMAVGKKSGYYTPFEDLLFNVHAMPFPATWQDDADVLQKEQRAFAWLDDYLEKYGKQTAALIIEPLVQGSTGMHMCREEFLRELEMRLRAQGILIIYDEVMTGFGRTGDYFACLKAQTTPDFICLSKGLSGGFLPLAMTVCTEKVYQAFLGDSFATAFAHGHTFTANPLGCAAALASMKLLKSAATQQQIKRMEAIHSEELQKLKDEIEIKQIRHCGTIAAFNLKTQTQYGSQLSVQLRERFYQKGLLIRPIGDVVYLLPPYCITEEDLRRSYSIIAEELQGDLV